MSGLGKKGGWGGEETIVVCVNCGFRGATGSRPPGFGGCRRRGIPPSGLKSGVSEDNTWTLPA